jgi:octaprenyl-diphosphate synthase
MAGLDQIRKPIARELTQFDEFFRELMKTEVPLLNFVMRYLLRRKGKQMRPILVFLSAKLLGQPGESTFTAAALIEIMHTATLIHDDVVDDSFERRGFFSINALWKSKVSVLVGDYLLAKGLLLSVNKKEYELLNIVADAVKEMSEGELLQIRNSRKVSVTQEEYFEIIRKKTATLISCCSATGAKSVGMPAETVAKMQRFGELLGIAFQIKDDLLDYQPNSLSGKPLGNDLKEKKLTLPLIHALEQAAPEEKRKILRLMHKPGKNSGTFREVLDFVEQQGGLAYADLKMNEYVTHALQILEEFPDGEPKESLRQFATYTIARNK